MSPAETAKLLTVIAANYQNFTIDETKHAVWHEMVGDIDYATANMAVKRHMASSKWPPTVADIREQCVGVSGDETVTAAAAWGELMQAVRRHGYYHEADALASMSPEVRKVAEMITWREINLSENLDVLRGQFLRMYENVRARSAREAIMPPDLRLDAIEAPRLRVIGAGE